LKRVEVPKKAAQFIIDRDRHAVVAVAGESKLHHAARLDLARAKSVIP
jgi:hypothetical protein